MRQPRSTVWLPALLLLAGFAAPALADREVVVRDESKAFPLEGARRLKLDVSVGEVHVDAGAGDRIEARLRLRCGERSRRCRERAELLRFEARRSGDDLSLKTSADDRETRRGMHHPEVELRLIVPAALAISVDMGVGELDLDGIEGDVSVDLGVGEARVSVPESAVRSVSMDVGVGEAHLSPRPEEAHRHGFHFLGNEIDWREGTGRSRVTVDVGVGEASVRLLQ